MGQEMFGKVSYYTRRVKEGRAKEVYQQIKWIYRYAKKHRFAIVAFTALGMAGTVISLITSLVSRDLVDIITKHKPDLLIKTFVLLIVTSLIATFIGQVSNYIAAKVSMKVDNEIKASLFDEIMCIEWESLAKFKSGEIVARWSGDASRISAGILNMFPNFVVLIFKVISSFYLVIRHDASFAIFPLVGVPVSFFLSRQSMKRLRKINMESFKTGAELSAFHQETFSNIQNVKAFDLIPLYSKRLRELQDEASKISLRSQRTEIINSVILSLASMVMSYSGQGWGVYKVWSGAISYGDMTMFMVLSSSLSACLNNLIALFPGALGVANSAKRLMDLTSLPKEDYSKREEVKAFFEKHKFDGIGVAVRDATYAYPKGENVFEKVYAEAHPHEVVAFVGPSGEGKTTMLRLILALIRAHNGTGYICAGDSTPETCRSDCMEMSASARQLFAYVPQGNTMFYGTIASNLRNVKEDATDEEIIEALKLACAWKFVEKLPDGINSEIMERGGGFSEGQAQRLSIARALLRKSPILLLDEATSALDIATEREVLKNIMTDDYPRTCIVTTHRPSVLNICSRVYSISDKQCILMSNDEIQKKIADF